MPPRDHWVWPEEPSRCRGKGPLKIFLMESGLSPNSARHRLTSNLSFPGTWYFLWFWLPPVLWCGCILLLSGDLGSASNTRVILTWLLSWLPPLSPSQVEMLHFYLRKTGHAAAYGFLYFLWFRAVRIYLGYAPGRAFFWSLGLCLVMAGLDEGRQSLFICRSASLRDVALDMGGALIAALIGGLCWAPKIKTTASK